MDSAKIAWLQDRIAIEGVLVKYCRVLDAREFDRFDEVFTPDASIDYTRAGGIEGSLEEIKEWLGTALAPFRVVQHMVSNFEIELDGDRASSVCYFHNPMGLAQSDGSVTMFWCGGRYRDDLVRTQSGWRIHRRVNELLYMHGAPAAAGSKR